MQSAAKDRSLQVFRPTATENLLRSAVRSTNVRPPVSQVCENYRKTNRINTLQSAGLFNQPSMHSLWITHGYKLSFEEKTTHLAENAHRYITYAIIET